MENSKIGRLLNGRYRIDKLLGRGGMAEVYKAYQESLNRFVAVKFIHPLLINDPEFEQRFRREARQVAALRHPHIVQVHDFDSEAGEPYMVMELIEGPTLAAHLDQLEEVEQQMSIAAVVRLGRDIGSALHYAHERGTLHRDVKPSNIMLDGDGRPVLADFGLAKWLDTAQLTSSGLTSGTPAYMAPELAQGRPGDSRSDLYSFGVVLYELLTGRPPFAADSPVGLIFMHINQPPPRPLDLRPDLPPVLEWITLKLLAKQPADRFESAAELLTQLDQIDFTSPISTRAPIPFPEFPRVPAPVLTGASSLEFPSSLTPSNLPPQVTSFIGRESELAAVKALLEQPDTRLITLTGPGGTGKTRLSLRVAAELLTQAVFPDGIYFVPLAALSDPNLVTAAIAKPFALQEAGGQSLLDSLKEHLGQRRLLLVLDNFEQVIAAAAQLAELLTAAPGLKLLVTSRVVLHLYGEQEYLVPPLQLPDSEHPVQAGIETLAAVPAVALFVARAQAARPDFRLSEQNAAAIAEICTRLDGLPLAIELAAARIKLLTPQAMLGRLSNRLALLTGGPRDLPARQQTLRAAIDWSYHLLDEDEKTLFARLSVFVGGRTLEAVEEIIGDWRLEIDDEPIANRQSPIAIFDTLLSLLEKSLLWQKEGPDGEPRFMMLDTIYEYAQERLVERGEQDSLRRQHATYFLKVAEAGDRAFKSPQQKAWIERLDAEHDNLRAALRWTVEQGEWETAARLAGALGRFWYVRGYLSEGRYWIERILSDESQLSAEKRAPVLKWAGAMAWAQGDLKQAQQRMEEDLVWSYHLEDKGTIAIASNNLAAILHEKGDYAGSMALFEQSLALHQEGSDPWNVATALSNIGFSAIYQGDYERAGRLQEESLIMRRQLKDVAGEGLSLINLALVPLHQGEVDKAIPLLQEGMAVAQRLNDRRNIFLNNLYLGLAMLLRGDSAAAHSYYQEALTEARSLGDRFGMARAIAGFATLAHLAGQTQRAAGLCAAAQSHRQLVGAHMTPAEQAAFNRTITALRTDLDPITLDVAWQAGASLPLEQAVSYALEKD